MMMYTGMRRFVNPQSPGAERASPSRPVRSPEPAESVQALALRLRAPVRSDGATGPTGAPDPQRSASLADMAGQIGS